VGSILLVEADTDSRERWSEDLARAGHSVLEASTMAEAPVVVREGGIDLVVIDCFGQCTGVMELAKEIELLPDAPPIVLVSSSPVAPEVSARIGAAAFLAKPCESHELLAVISRIVETMRPVLAFEDEPTGLTKLG
jgi:DNA-binding NtrC family response regulator